MTLVPVDDGPAVVVCNTCRTSIGNGRLDGALLLAALCALRASDCAYDGIAVQAMPCLFACNAACTVHIRAPGRIGYVLGRFVPDAEAARAILDYAVAYAASDAGEVPFADWPDGVKGRFITRTPPAGFVVE